MYHEYINFSKLYLIVGLWFSYLMTTNCKLSKYLL